MKRFALAMCLAASAAVVCPILGQDTENIRTPSAKNIRVRRLGLDLKGETVTVVMKDGREMTGLLMGTDFERFFLSKDGTEAEVPIDEAVSVILPPGVAELTLAGLSGLLTAGFGSGVATLALDDPGQGTVIGAGVFGLVLGTWLGYRTFYQEDVIELE